MEQVVEVNVLHEITELLLKEHQSVHAFLKDVLVKANELIGSDIGYIGLVEEDENGQRWVVVKAKNIIGARCGEESTYLERLKVGGEELPKEERSFTGYVAVTKKVKNSRSVEEEEFYKASNKETKSELAVPILLQGESLGIVNLESKTPDFYTEEHEKILQIVARLVARPLHSLMMREGLRRPLAEVLDEVRHTLNDVPPGDLIEASDALNKIAFIVAGALSSRSCTIWLLNRQRTELILRGAFGPHHEYVNQHREEVGETLAWRAIRQRCLLTFGPNYPRDEHSGKFDLEVYGKTLTTPLTVAPLVARGEAIGVIKVGLKEQTEDNPQGYYTDWDQHMLNLTQGQIAAAIELRRLEIDRRETIVQQIGHLSALADIISDVNLNTALERTVKNVPGLCNGLNCSIFLDPSIFSNGEPGEKFVLVATSELPQAMVGEAFYYPGEGLTGWVAKYGRPLNITTRDPIYLQEVRKEIHPVLEWKGKYNDLSLSPSLEFRPYIGVPIFRYGQSIGVIRVCDRKEGAFDESDLQCLTLVASHISAAIAFSLKYHDRIKLLREMQRLLILNKGFGEDKIDLDEFEEVIVEEAAKGAAEVLKTDILTLYKYRADKGEFETPPIIKDREKVKHLEFMQTNLYPDDVPWKILKDGSQYWDDTRDARALIGEIPARDGLPPRPRFVVRERIVSSAGIRLEVGRKAVGVMFLNFRTSQSFDPEKKEIIGTFASHIAIFLEIVRLYREIKESASREEAAYLAQELHDAVLQILSLAVVNRSGLALDELRNRNFKGVERHLKVIENASEYCAEEIRHLMGLLNTHVVDDLGLAVAVRRFVDFWKPENLKVDFKVSERGPLVLRAQRHLYRIFQAAFSNVIAHAQASRLKITLNTNVDYGQLVIEDDGVGFDADAALREEGRYGLRGIKWRVNALKGKMNIDSRVGKGTTLSVAIPGREVTHEN